MSRIRQSAKLTGAAGAGVVAALALAACSPPGAGTADNAPAPEAGADVTWACGSEPVTLEAYLETDFPLAEILFEEFTNQHPNVTFNVRTDEFSVLTQNAPRVLVDSPPDIMRLPMVSELAADGLLFNFDEAADYFGWNDWPGMSQLRVDSEGRRGEGSIFAMGLNMQMTGVFYNRALAEQIGMTEAPATLAELDEVMQRAKDAGITPITQWNGGAEAGTVFPLQGLMASYGSAADINAWIFQQPGATIDTPEFREALAHLNRWIEAGFFAEDINALSYGDSLGRFNDEQALFTFNGNWEAGNFDADRPGEVGFFAVPPVEEGGAIGAMAAPLTFGTSARAENAGCAAYFFNWLATDEVARTINIETGGSMPMGPADAFMPELDETTTTAATLSAAAEVAEHDGAMDFVANATGAIFARGWTPPMQRLVEGGISVDDVLAEVQAVYLDEIGG